VKKHFMTLTALVIVAVKASGAIGNVVVTSAASFEVGSPTKGSIATIFCTGLESISGIVSAQSTPLPRELAGVRVKVGGAEAPIFAVVAHQGYQQINIQVPQEAAIQLPSGWPEGTAEATVEVAIEQGGQRASAQVVVRRSPGEFFEMGNGFAVLQHASDFSLVTQQNPARPDEVLVAYLTGLRATDPVVPSGIPSPVNPLAVIPRPLVDTDSYNIVLRLGENTVDAYAPEFVGLVPGLVGVYQYNFRLRGQEILFFNRPPIPYDTEIYLLRTYCSGVFCSPSSYSRFRGKAVRIPVAPKQ
jgi:uncharacterized protein (TIGR03437 family)